jgi:hypothetical protein
MRNQRIPKLIAPTQSFPVPVSQSPSRTQLYMPQVTGSGGQLREHPEAGSGFRRRSTGSYQFHAELHMPNGS